MFVFPRNSGHWFKPEFLMFVSERTPAPHNPTTNHQITPPSELPFPHLTTPRGFSRGRIPLNPEEVMGFQGDLGGRLAYPWSLWPQRVAENPLTQNQKIFQPTTRNSEPTKKREPCSPLYLAFMPCPRSRTASASASSHAQSPRASPQKHARSSCRRPLPYRARPAYRQS